mmetsp:Transcript_26030/g.80100  ORF Transcript_26030/g.80100 Transcript_26030/m.80100 type:complete len:93 (-) Transcript_26030:22-300(-)
MTQAEASAKAAAESEAAAKEAEETRKALEALEQAKADAIAKQEALGNDESLSTVKRNKAKVRCRAAFSRGVAASPPADDASLIRGAAVTRLL